MIGPWERKIAERGHKALTDLASDAEQWTAFLRRLSYGRATLEEENRRRWQPWRDKVLDLLRAHHEDELVARLVDAELPVDPTELRGLANSVELARWFIEGLAERAADGLKDGGAR